MMLFKTKDESTEWRDWEIFCRIVEMGSFSAACDRTGIARSTVSMSVARLERQLGVRLLNRNTRSVLATDVGRRLYTRAAPLFAALYEAEAEAKSSIEEVSGTLRISAPYECAWMHLSQALVILLRKHHSLRVEIDDSRTIPDLIAGHCDIALVRPTDKLPDSSLVSKRVDLMDRAFYASARMIDEKGFPDAPANIELWPAIVDVDDQFWDVLENEREVARIEVQPRIRTPNSEIRLQAALRGLGMARLETRRIQRYIDSGELTRILPTYSSSPANFYAVMPSRQSPPKVRAFLKALELARG